MHLSVPSCCCRFFGLCFFFVPLATIVANYSTAILCGNRCYSNSKSPCHYPDALFVSSTLHAEPTRFIGVIGFSLTSMLGLLVAISRFLQVNEIIDGFQLHGVAVRKLKFRNWCSLVYMVIFAVANAIMAGVPLKDDPTMYFVHILSSLTLEGSLMGYLYLQIECIECHLKSVFENEVTLLTQKKNIDWKERLWWIALVFHVSFQISFKALDWFEDGSTVKNVSFVLAAILENVTIAVTLSIIGCTNFTAILTQYKPHLIS